MAEPSTTPPGGGSEPTASRNIGGFADDYSPRGHLGTIDYTEGGVRLGPPRTPLYRNGDEWMPNNWSRDRVYMLQQALYMGGFIGPDDTITPYRFDPVTRSAFRDLLEYANSSAADWESTLAGFVEEPLVRPTDSARKPFVAEVANSADIASKTRDLAREQLGAGAAVDAHMGEIVSGFQQKQIAAQRAAYDATGGTIEAPPSLETFADQKFREIDPVRYDSRKVVEKFDVIAKMLGGQ